MKKLIFLFLFLPFFVFGQITINNVKKNKKNFKGLGYSSFSISSGFFLDSYQGLQDNTEKENFISLFINPTFNFNHLINDKIKIHVGFAVPISLRQSKDLNYTYYSWNTIEDSYLISNRSIKSSVEFNFGFSYKINTLLTTTLESSTAVLNLENQKYSSNDNIYFVDGNLYGHNGGGTNLKFDYLFFDNLSSYISISRKRKYNFLESLLDGIRLNATTEYITQLTLGINYKL
tara:strand:- start:1065 stop:1760 length:696 start_codon:yes stop_codon:yes gene_type:complete